VNTKYISIIAQPAKKPERGPSEAPTNPYTLPALLYLRASSMNAYPMKMQVTAANRNDSAAARPTRAAIPGPEKAIARAGEAPATDSPMASQMCSSRRSLAGRGLVPTAILFPPSPRLATRVPYCGIAFLIGSVLVRSLSRRECRS
jgi:hypothetical protein